MYSQLDYCNTLYSGISQGSLHRLQLVQNAAACLIGTKKDENITPMLASLHWLAVSFSIDLEILLLTFKALHSLAPSYLSDLLKWYVPPRSTSTIYRWSPAELVTKGDRTFTVRAPTLWSSTLNSDMLNILFVCSSVISPVVNSSAEGCCFSTYLY